MITANTTLYIVDLATFKAEILHQLQFPDPYFVDELVGMIVDQGRIFIGAFNNATNYNGFVSFSLRNGRFLSAVSVFFDLAYEIIF